jgi:membrane-associated phospholipid phosphatase
MKFFFGTLPRNIFESFFKDKNFIWHLLAFVLTAIIVLSGLDWHYYLLTRGIAFNPFFFSAVIVGAIIPMYGLPLMLLCGWLKRSAKTRMLAWILGQAALLGYLISSFYKALTGRIPPPHDTAVDISRYFNFGFFKEGIFWGWPSSHTSVAFAMAFALMALYPKNKTVMALSIIYAFYIGIGISLNIHWLSEFVAGAIIGAVIGTVVGKSYKAWFKTVSGSGM